MVTEMRRLLSLAGVAAITASVGAASAGATQITTTIATCTSLNCGGVSLRGNTFVTEGRTIPFVVQLFGGANECVRIETTSQTADLRIVAIAPDGVVYNNDDGGSCSLCSLVKIPTGSRKGYYTIQLAQFGGVAVESLFEIKYGRYKPGNPNCANPTTPLLNRKAID